LEPPLSDEGIARQTAAGLRILDLAAGRHVRVRDENGKEVRRLDAPQYGVQMSPDGSLLAAFLDRDSRASDLALYEVASGKRFAPWAGHTGAITSAVGVAEASPLASIFLIQQCVGHMD